jgi:hypothetical protein
MKYELVKKESTGRRVYQYLVIFGALALSLLSFRAGCPQPQRGEGPTCSFKFLIEFLIWKGKVSCIDEF